MPSGSRADAIPSPIWRKSTACSLTVSQRGAREMSEPILLSEDDQEELRRLVISENDGGIVQFAVSRLGTGYNPVRLNQTPDEQILAFLMFLSAPSMVQPSM